MEAITMQTRKRMLVTTTTMTTVISWSAQFVAEALSELVALEDVDVARAEVRGRGQAQVRGRGQGRGRGRGRGAGAGAGAPAGTKSWGDVDGGGFISHENFVPRRPAGPHFPPGFQPTCELDFFELFFSRAVMENFVQFSNDYAEEEIENKPSYKDKSSGAWKPTDVEELKKFIGLLIYSGLVKTPSFDNFWSCKSLYNGLAGRSFIGSATRFWGLLAMFRPSPHNAPGNDELKKVCYLIDHMRTSCQALFQPSQQLSIDERMVKC